MRQVYNLDEEFARLREILAVAAFGRIVSRIDRQHLSDAPFQGRAWKSWQEAWIAWQFATFDKATHLRLAEENADDDFFVKRKEADWIGFQATEALLEGRQRSREYRELLKSGIDYTEDDSRQIQRESDGAVPAIISAFRKKSLSTRNGHLVVYWNTGWLVDGKRFIAELEEATEPYRPLFREAWLMGKASVFRIAPHFEMLEGPPISFRGAN